MWGGGGYLPPVTSPPPPPDPPVVREFPVIIDKLILEVFFFRPVPLTYDISYIYLHIIIIFWATIESPFFFFFFFLWWVSAFPYNPSLSIRAFKSMKPCGKKVLKLSGCYWGPLMLKKLTVVLWCVYMCLKQKNNFIYMTKILLLLIKLVCDTTWLSSYFNTISKTLPWYINELIVNLI